MWNEIKGALSCALEGDKGRKTRKALIFGSVGALILLFLNRFIFFNLVDFDHFFIHSALARLLFLNDISPYRTDIIPVLNNFFSTRPIDATPEAFKFTDPVFQLFFYLPFSLIQDPRWSAALFLTINQGILIGSLEVVFRLLRWRPEWKTRLWMTGITILSCPSLFFFINPDLTIIQFFLFLMGVDLSMRSRAVPGGIMLGLSLLSFSIVLLPLLFLISYMSFNKKRTPVIWFLISTGLLSLLGAIFDNNWLLKMIRNFFAAPQYFPFTSYSSVLGTVSSGAILPTLVNFVPVILFVMIALEWVRMPKESHLHLYWLISFLITMNPVIAAVENFQPSPFSIFVYSFIIYLWVSRSEGIIKKYLLGVFVLIYVILPFIGKLFPDVFIFLNSSVGYNLILFSLTLTMLYWVRWWVVQNPLDGVEFED